MKTELHSTQRQHVASHTKVTSLLQPCCNPVARLSTTTLLQGCHKVAKTMELKLLQPCCKVVARLLQGCGKVAVRLWRHCNKKRRKQKSCMLSWGLEPAYSHILPYCNITLPLEPICFLTSLCCCSCIYSCNGILYQPSLVWTGALLSWAPGMNNRL